MDRRRPEYIRALGGIRTYAFLGVFFTHYNLTLDRPRSLWQSPMWAVLNLTWFLVPIFFVMSGFLITRILLSTREKTGYFRVFYLRRAIRVFPLYYTVVAIATVAAVLLHYHLTFKHGLYLLQLQNFTNVRVGQFIDVSHLWSLAIEEQFYLLWPLVVWWLTDEEALLRFTYALIAACTLFRVLWPLWHLSPWHAYTFTPNRVDAILLGCALAIHHKRTENWNRYVLTAKIGLPVLVGSMFAVLLVQGTTLPQLTYTGIAFCTPVMNLIGMGFVILALAPDSLVERACSGNRVCAFGKLTYGLYLIHQIYSPVFFLKLTPMLTRWMRPLMAEFATTVIALAFTTLLAWVANRVIEQPLAQFRHRFRYGSVEDRGKDVEVFAVSKTEPALSVAQ